MALNPMRLFDYLPGRKQSGGGASSGTADTRDEETRWIEETLRNFAEESAPNTIYADYDALRGYLSDRRIGFFRELLDLCVTAGVRFEGRRVADMGSGTGYLLRLLHGLAPQATLTGYDTHAEMNQLARRLCPQAEIREDSFYELDTPYDVVFCMETLEHMLEPHRALLKLFDLVAAGGTLILTVPDGRRDQQAAGALREDGTAYWGHVHFWSPESWRLFLERELKDRARIATGQCSTGENYAVISRGEPA